VFISGEDIETFTERAARMKEKHKSGNGAGMTLATAARAWPTPATRDFKGANSADHLDAGTGRKHLDQLPNFVAHVWATPTASANSNRTTKMAPRHGKTHGVVLAGQAADLSRNWQTPTQIHRKSEKAMRPFSEGGQSSPPGIGQQADTLASSLQDRTTKQDGDTSSEDRRILNPRFVEWLMGWPPMWTSFACSATELSLWKQRMRSALLSLGLPREAPPAQLALFG
jgi:hypothetical protein